MPNLTAFSNSNINVNFFYSKTLLNTLKIIFYQQKVNKLKLSIFITFTDS